MGIVQNVLVSFFLGMMIAAGSGVAVAHEGTSPAPGIVWHAGLDEALAEAQQQKRPAFIDFSSSWCSGCKDLDEKTFTDPRVITAAGRFVPIRILIPHMDDATRQLMRRYSIEAFPAVVFVSSAGKVLAEPRVTDFLPADKFLAMLKQVK